LIARCHIEHQDRVAIEIRRQLTVRGTFKCRIPALGSRRRGSNLLVQVTVCRLPANRGRKRLAVPRETIPIVFGLERVFPELLARGHIPDAEHMVAIPRSKCFAVCREDHQKLAKKYVVVESSVKFIWRRFCMSAQLL